MFQQPASLSEALDALASGSLTPICGATDVFPALVDRPPTPLLDLTRIADMRGIDIADDCIRIGASTTWRDIIRAPLPPVFAMLKQAAHQVGSIQIQNRATIGGNLCNASPAADGVPPLLALDAEVELASHAGRRVLPLAEFLHGNRRTALAPGELLVSIRVPRRIEGAGAAFLKLGTRKYLVISIVMVAAALDIHDGHVREARIAVGAASAVAQRLRSLEAKLVGTDARRSFLELISSEDLAALTPIDDVRATAAFRTDAARELVARTLRQAADARPA